MEQKLIQSFTEKYGNSRLISPIQYIFSKLTDVDLNLIKIIQYVEIFLNEKYKTNIKLDKLIYTFSCLYHSNKIIYDLPHVMNKVNYNTKPCLHIIYGETISELVSLSLYTECLEYMNNLYLENNVSKTIRNNSIKLFFDKLININLDFKNIKLEKFHRDLYLLAIDVSVNIFLETPDKSINDKIINDIENKYLIDLSINYDK